MCGLTSNSCELCRYDNSVPREQQRHWATCQPRIPMRSNLCKACRKELQTKVRVPLSILHVIKYKGALPLGEIGSHEIVERRASNLMRILKGNTALGEEIWQEVYRYALRLVGRIWKRAEVHLKFAMDNGVVEELSQHEIAALSRRKCCTVKNCSSPVVGASGTALLCQDHFRISNKTPSSADKRGNSRRQAKAKTSRSRANSTPYDINLRTAKKLRTSTSYSLGAFELKIATAAVWFESKGQHVNPAYEKLVSIMIDLKNAADLCKPSSESKVHVVENNPGSSLPRTDVPQVADLLRQRNRNSSSRIQNYQDLCQVPDCLLNTAESLHQIPEFPALLGEIDLGGVDYLGDVSGTFDGVDLGDIVFKINESCWDFTNFVGLPDVGVTLQEELRLLSVAS